MFESFLRAVGSVARTHSFDLCSLETGSLDDKYTLVGRDGSLATMFCINGIDQIVAEESFTKIADGLNESFNTLFKKGCHSVDWSFTRDHEYTVREVKAATAAASNTAIRLNLDLEDEIQSNRNVISDFVTFEDGYMMLWTYPSSLLVESLKASQKEKAAIRDKLKINFGDSQNLLAEIKDVRDTHYAFIEKALSDFRFAGLSCTKLTAKEACRAIKLQIDAPATNKEWEPVLTGDKIFPRISSVQKPKTDISDILWPSLGWQLCQRDIIPVSGTDYVQVGDRYYAPLLMELPPNMIQPFTRFFDDVDRFIPYRIRYLMRGDGLDGVASFKHVLAAFTAFPFAPDNKKIRDHINGLSDHKNIKNRPVVKLQISLCTWSDDLAVLKQNVQRLIQAFQGWGGGELISEKGDKAEAYISTVVGFSNRSCATPTVIKAEEMVPLLPFMRPSAKWKRGSILFATRDNRLWPWQPRSSLQAAWIELWCARSGSGKSMTGNAISFAVCLSAGLKELPRIVTIDIGPGSSGVVQLLHDAMPKDRHHEAIYHKMQITEDHAVNPFDLQLGCEYPLPHDLTFLQDFIALLVQPLEGEPISNMRELVVECIDYLYKIEQSPVSRKRFSLGVDSVVDNIIGILPEGAIDLDDEYLSWRDVTNILFKYGYINEAVIAQRYAVPTLIDLVGIDTTAPVIKGYEQLKVSGESLVSAMTRLLSSAIKMYPCLSQPTKIGFSSARVCAIDLNDVATTSRQTAVMYMLARQFGTRDFYLNDDLVVLWPEMYRSYQRDRISKIRSEIKRVIYEELHRTEGQLMLRKAIRRDCSEGRKTGVNVVVVSQLIEDFDAEMIKQATTIAVMGSGVAEESKTIAKKLGLSAAAESSMENGYLHGPTKGGPCFLMRYETKSDGWCEQLLRVPKSPEELWALSTTAIDTDIRRDLTATLGGDSKKARRQLVKRFPGGSAEEYVEILKEGMSVKNKNRVEKEADIMASLLDEIRLFKES